MKIILTCDGGVIPACLDHVNYRIKPGRIRILEFIIPDDNFEILSILAADPEVWSFEVNKPEKWRLFFTSEEERYATIAETNKAFRELYNKLNPESF